MAQSSTEIKTIAIQCPTYYRATFEWKWYVRNWTDAIKKATRNNLTIELASGFKLKFVVGPREIRGLNCKTISIDDFEFGGLFKHGRTNDNL